MSHPARVRGLKPSWTINLENAHLVAPRTGAWIETGQEYQIGSRRLRSHPARVRGLKHLKTPTYCIFGMSHPARVRGLKPVLYISNI